MLLCRTIYERRRCHRQSNRSLLFRSEHRRRRAYIVQTFFSFARLGDRLNALDAATALDVHYHHRHRTHTSERAQVKRALQLSDSCSPVLYTYVMNHSRGEPHLRTLLSRSRSLSLPFSVLLYFNARVFSRRAEFDAHNETASERG